MGDYYSRRNQPYAREVTREFWNAFKAYIDELVDQDWLFEQFGEEGYDFDREYRFIVSEKVKRKMLQELGCDLYPLPNNTPANEITFNLIEFFFKFISVQVKDGFDRGKATYQYTIRINQLFENFKLSYKLEKGTVKPRHSGVMDRTITKDDFIIEDKETQTLINLAVEKFYDLKPSEQKIGLEKLVDAFQRVSSWEDNNKKRSVNSILDVLCKDQPALRTPLETELRSLWNTANEFMIRHTEMDKIKITDSDFLEYLFYRYYILLRFAFKKYGMSRIRVFRIRRILYLTTNLYQTLMNRYNRGEVKEEGLSTNLSVAVVAHTHSARMARETVEARNYYLMDCGSWVNGGHEIGLLSGNDIAICQWG